MFVNGADAGPGCWSSPTHPHSPWQRRAASFYILCLIFLLISHRYKCWPTTRSSGLGGVPRDVQLPAPGLADGQFPKSHSGVLGWGLGGCTEQGRGALPAAEHLVSAYCVPGTSLDEFYSCAFFFFSNYFNCKSSDCCWQKHFQDALGAQRAVLGKVAIPFPTCSSCRCAQLQEGLFNWLHVCKQEIPDKSSFKTWGGHRDTGTFFLDLAAGCVCPCPPGPVCCTLSLLSLSPWGTHVGSPVLLAPHHCVPMPLDADYPCPRLRSCVGTSKFHRKTELKGHVNFS